MRKRVFILCFVCIVAILSNAHAQLPPTIHRVSQTDSAVDVPMLTSLQSALPPVCPSYVSPWNTAYTPQGGHCIFKTSAAGLAFPLTVSFAAKVASAKTFGIFTAFEPKSSPWHWELYTFANSGKFSLYMPGNKAGNTLSGGPNLADSKWHRLTAVLTRDKAELFVDGKSVAQGRIDLSKSNDSVQSLLAIGSLVNGTLPLAGAMDEFHITAGGASNILDMSNTNVIKRGAQTVLLGHFDLSQSEQSVKNGNRQMIPRDAPKQSTAERFTRFPQYLRAPDEPQAKQSSEVHFSDVKQLLSEQVFFAFEGTLVDQGQFVAEGTACDNMFPGGGEERIVLPGDKPKRNIPIQPVNRQEFMGRVHELGIVSVSFDDFRAGVFEYWGEQYIAIQEQLTGKKALPRGAQDQVYDDHTLVWPDREIHPVQVVTRRAQALAERLEEAHSLDDVKWASVRDLSKLVLAYRDVFAAKMSPEEKAKRDIDYFITCALRRKLLFGDPELNGLDKILFLGRACYAGSRLTNPHNTDRTGGHFATQVYGFNTIAGGGLFAISNWREKTPVVSDLIKDRKVVATNVCQRLAGRKLDEGSFMAPEVGFDGKTIYFSHCGSKEHRWFWSPDTTWNIFKMSINGNTIEQLTDSAYNDFDVCELPSGRLVFCSERRGGFIRCFAESARLRVTTSVLHGMKADGSDIYPLSFFETSEWQPSVDHNGMLVYTRWDYTDRENCLGSTFWTCFPDGRNPRSPHGNYPYPWHTFEDNQHGDHRFGKCPDAPSGLPMTEMQFRAIPDSHRYIFTAAPHHGETFGSLCLLDLRVKNDNHMSQVKRLTPYAAFPESESPGRSQYQYGSPWPINEDLYLCNDWENLILLDRFGNTELVCERELLPIGYDPRLRLTDPIPLCPRTKPPVIPQQTTQGIDYVHADHRATIGVVNVNITDQPFPKDRPVKRLRVIQVIPKPNPWMDTPWIGYATENTPRIALGTVPVEKDGSAFFEAPYGKQLLFQPLDEKNRAIQTMRAVAFVHPGEKLICIGCHEPIDHSVANEKTLPLAFSRPASKLEPECGPVEPVNFYRQIKPIFDNRCVSCHVKEKKGPQIMDYESMRPYVYYYSGSMSGGTVRTGTHGGSRACPGRVGASEAKLGSIVFDEHHKNTVSDADRHQIILWLDANAPRLGAFQDEKAQMDGQLVWPLLDTDACDQYNPTQKDRN